MTMLKTIKLLSVVSTVGVLLIGFQNCSKIQMQDMEAANPANLSLGAGNDTTGDANTPNGISSEELPDNTSSVIIQPPLVTQLPEEVVSELPSPAPAPAPEMPNQPIANGPGIVPPGLEPLPPVNPPEEEILPPVVMNPPQLPVKDLPILPPSEDDTANPPQTPVVVIPPPLPQPEVTEWPTPITPITDSPEDEDCVVWALEKEKDEVKAACLHRNEHADNKDKKDDDRKSQASSDENKSQDNKDKKDNDDDKSNRSYASDQSKSKDKQDDDDDKDSDENKSQASSPDHDNNGMKERCYVKPEEDKDDHDYSQICTMRPKALGLLKQISQFLTTFKLRGFTIITPDTVGASSIDSLEDARGLIIVCGMEIDKVHNTRGKLVMVDSKIGEWSNHRGKAVLMNTKADSCSDLRGKVSLLGENSECSKMENTRGLITVAKGL